MLAGARGPGHAPSGSVADTLTTAYDVAGIRVLQRRTESSDIVAVRLYLLGGTRQITERTAGIEPLMLRAAAYHGGRALDRTGSVVALKPEADWTVYGITGPVEDLDATWRAFVDRLVQSELSDEAVAGARRRLLTQARRRYTEPDPRLPVSALRDLFTDQPPTAGQAYWAFRVATAVLSGQIGYHIRAEHSLSYAAFAPFYDQAIPVGGAYVSTPKPDEALALIHQAIREIATLRFSG